MKGLSIKWNYNRNNYLNKENKASLQMQIHCNNNTRYLFVASLHPKQWDDAKQEIKIIGGSKKLTKEERKYLEDAQLRMLQMKTDATAFYKKRMEVAGYVSALEIKNHLLDENKVENFIDFVKTEISLNSNIGESMAKTGEVFLNILTDFKPVITFKELNKNFVREFESFLRKRKKSDGDFLKDSYITQTLRKLKMYTDRAEEYLSTEPFRKFKFNPVVSENAHLELDDLLNFEQIKIKNNYRLCYLTKDLYLFASWTGLRYSDLVERKIPKGEKESFGLKLKHLKKTDKGLVLTKEPKKTRKQKRVVELPLYNFFAGKPQELLEKYLRGKGKNDYVFPNISPNHINRWTKYLLQEIDYDKPLRFHSSRHNFGHIMHNDFDVPLHILKLFMGHNRIESTMIYAKTEQRTANKFLQDIDWSKLDE